MKILLVDDYLDALEALSLYLVAVGFVTEQSLGLIHQAEGTV